MFSSTNNLHLFPLQHYFPSSSSSSYHLVPPPPQPVPNAGGDVVFVPQDPLFLHVPDEEGARMKNEQQEVVVVNGQCFSSSGGLINNNNSFAVTKKGTAKKDRHSKIYTAQGLRDRRVRLSIEISRKFFDLQDMLGYDKASKTLDWLLTKSRKAIKDLTKTRHKFNNNNINNNLYNFDDSEECEVISNDESDHKIMLAAKSSKKNVATFHDVVAKESRAKARARARERTKEKMMMIMSNKSQQQPIIPENLNHHQFRSPPPPASSSSSVPIIQKGATVGANSSDQENNNNFIGIMTWKPSPMITSSNYQKNLVISSKGDTYNYNNCNNFYFPSNLPPNWDINIDSFARTQSGFCSIANMDSLPEFQVCAKPWDNQHLH